MRITATNSFDQVLYLIKESFMSNNLLKARDPMKMELEIGVFLILRIFHSFNMEEKLTPVFILKCTRYN